MKTTLLFLSALFLFPALVFGAEVSPATQKILSWADKEIADIQSDIRNAEASETRKNCFFLNGWRLELTLRLSMGYDEMQQSVRLMMGNACLRDDVNELDNRLARITRLTSHSALACDSESAAFRRADLFIRQLMLMKETLVTFGDENPALEKTAAKNGQHPFLQSGAVSVPKEFAIGSGYSFADAHYQNAEICQNTASYFQFRQVKAKIKEIMKKIQRISEGISEGTDFFTGEKSWWEETKKRAQKNAQKKADEWYSRNIESTIKKPISNMMSGVSISRPTLEQQLRKAGYSESEIQEKIKGMGLVGTLSSGDPLASGETALRENKRAIEKSVRLTTTNPPSFSATGSYSNIFQREEVEKKKYKERLQDSIRINESLRTGILVHQQKARSMEADARHIPPLTKHTNEELLRVKELLRDFCSRHSPCNYSSSGAVGNGWDGRLELHTKESFSLSGSPQ